MVGGVRGSLGWGGQGTGKVKVKGIWGVGWLGDGGGDSTCFGWLLSMLRSVNTLAGLYF